MREVELQSLFLRIYWGSRKESRADCAARLANFLTAAMAIDPAFKLWFSKANRRKDALVPADISGVGIEGLLKANNKATTGEPIAQLGFSLGLWNGQSASISALVGAYSPYVGNSVVLSFNGKSPSSGSIWRSLIENAVEAFDPESAVVTNHAYIASHGDGAPDEAGGWFLYRRGESIAESVFP